MFLQLAFDEDLRKRCEGFSYGWQMKESLKIEKKYQ